MINKAVAIICNYELLPGRVGGMDYFFWDFDKKCKENNIEIDWFFTNKASHGEYSNLTIYSGIKENAEEYFLNYYKENKKDYTHIITHFVELCTPFFYKIKQFSNAKIIAVDHNPRPINGYSFKKIISKKLKGILFSRYIDLFVGVSNYTVNAILKDFGSHVRPKTMTIYNGVIFENILIRDTRNNVKPSFLVASHLRESKGIQDLIEAVQLLSNPIKSQIKIDIYGDGPYKNKLVDKIKRYNLQKCFTFYGSKSNLNEIFYNYDYMLQPTYMECFSLSILESLAANVPVITTNVGGNTEVVMDNVNGYIFEAKDIQALATIIKKLYTGEQKIIINTRELIANSFSLPKMIENHFELLKEKVY